MIISKSILKKVYKKRPAHMHKYDYGALLVVGGSEKYSGSPAFNALAALTMSAYRSGVDIVEVAAPERSANIIATFSPDIITIPLKGNFVSMKHIPLLLKESRNKSAVVIGGGMGRKAETLKAVIAFLKATNLLCVIDADAIYAVARKKEVVKSNYIITPHAYEFFVLTGKKVNKLNLKQKIKIVRESAAKLNNCTILLKGNPDIISDGKRIGINKTGNAFMTVGGTGDTLAGICGSLFAQDINTFDAACAAAYINGKAGDIVAKSKKQALVASDLIEAISEVIA